MYTMGKFVGVRGTWTLSFRNGATAGNARGTETALDASSALSTIEL